MKNHGTPFACTTGQFATVAGRLAVALPKALEASGLDIKAVLKWTDEGERLSLALAEAFKMLYNGHAATVPNVLLKMHTERRTFEIGGCNSVELLAKAKVIGIVGIQAKNLMTSSAFAVRSTVEKVDTIILAPSDLDYDREAASFELFDPARLATWSRLNAKYLDGHVVDLLPVEACPFFRINHQSRSQYRDLYVASERIVDPKTDFPYIFCMGQGGGGTLWFDAVRADATFMWNPNSRFMFRLRKA